MSRLTYRRGCALAVAMLVLASCSTGTDQGQSGPARTGASGSSPAHSAASGHAAPSSQPTDRTSVSVTGSGSGSSPPTSTSAESDATSTDGGSADSTDSTDDATGTTVVGAPTDCTLPAGAQQANVQSDMVPLFVAVLPARGRFAAHARGTVLLSNESDEDLCAWLPFASTLRSNGFAVALYNYQGPSVDAITAITGWLRQRGAQRVVLMGASVGAKATIIAAATLDHPPAAAVALSAEAVLNGTAVWQSAQHLKTPTLLVTAAQDPNGAAIADRQIAKAAPHEFVTLTVVPGKDHGTALLHGSMPTKIIHFLTSHVGAPDAPSSGSAAPSSTSPTTPPASSADAPMGCPIGARTDDRYLPGPDGSNIQLESIGSGRTVAVFLHEKGTRGMCGFAEYAAWVAAKQHIRAVLFDFCGYGETSCPATEPTPWKLTATVVKWVRQQGAKRVVLVGASAGGGDALVAASQIRPAVDAVVDLSGDDGDGAHMMTAARTLSMPVMYAVAVDDAFCPVSTMRALSAATPGHGSTLKIIKSTPGAHGWNLLPGTSGGARWSPLAKAIARWIAG